MEPATLRIDLPAELGVTEAEVLKERLLSALSDGSDGVALDGALVRRIGAAALQVLVAFAIEQQRSGLRLTWTDSSSALRECARTSGLDQLLALSD